MVGTSGSASIRFSVVTASTRTAPLRTCCKVDADSAKCTFTWPPSSALSTSALPLNGTCTSLAPVWLLNISAARWVDVPPPDDA